MDNSLYNNSWFNSSKKLKKEKTIDFWYRLYHNNKKNVFWNSSQWKEWICQKNIDNQIKETPPLVKVNFRNFFHMLTKIKPKILNGKYFKVLAMLNVENDQVHVINAHWDIFSLTGAKFYAEISLYIPLTLMSWFL